MAIGDYAKTVYISGQAPAISASNLNKNENKTDEVDKALASHTAETAVEAHLAKNIGIEDTSENFTASDVEGAMAELFTSVSDGKDLVGTAITDVDPSVTVPTDPTFAELVAAIGQISSGKKWASGTFSGSKVLNIADLAFTPRMGFYFQTAANGAYARTIALFLKDEIIYQGDPAIVYYSNSGISGTSGVPTWGENSVTGIPHPSSIPIKWYVFD